MDKNEIEVNKGISIEVQASYVPEESDPSTNYYFFAYKIKITNVGIVVAQLINRHWIITDGFGRTSEVNGPGVVGKQPSLAPGESFEYTSFCPLPTATGSMQGSYEMKNEDGRITHAIIPQFFLVKDNSYH